MKALKYSILPRIEAHLQINGTGVDSKTKCLGVTL